ncbi:DNRLRE domain-containing protein [Herbidospora mongoliensis]|uniref:DNRLRE domain-containing protein n=1 Tax=Herbidospora mongoliensis TaxID=688067 RepID=UPI0012FCC582|nr:DNRLRE domain-containing protein [Herbidospora mongoliensis]
MSTPASAQNPSPPPTPPPALAEPPPETPTEKALAQAEKDNRRVEIESMRSESATYYANPDGKTVRMELSTKPIRVRTADGKGLTPIDTTLVATGGVIRPKAVAGGLALSDGQDRTLLKADAEAKITTASVLPAPKLKGNTATYPDAYGQGRDLLVAATPTGFQQKVVIRQRPAGPVSFRVPVDLPEGLSFKKGGAGRPVIVGADGKTVTEVRPTLVQDARAADSTGPLDAGKAGTAAVTLAEDGTTLVFTPEAAFLADPAVVYPVTLMAAAGDWWEGHTGQYEGMDTWINDYDYQDSWNTFNQDQIVVGKSYASNIAKRWRGYLQFPDIPDTFAGATVENADLHLWNYLSNACGNPVGTGITARRITTYWDELSLEWGSQPYTTNVGANNEGGAYSEDCTGAMGYPWTLTHSLNTVVQEWVNGADNYGIQLTAGNESELRNWRRYRPEEAGGCRTTPLEDCKGQLHPPILTVDFLMPEPEPEPVLEDVVMMTNTELTNLPTYEEAIAMSAYRPPGTESVMITETLANQIAANRDGQVEEIGPENLDSGDDSQGGDGEGGDTSPPRVISVEPAAGAVEVPLDALVKVTFSEPVSSAHASVIVKDAGGTQAEGVVTLDATEKVLTFTSAQALEPGDVHTVEVSGAIDEGENEMAPHTWSFTTLRQAAAHWRFDEEEGATTADSSGNDRDATLNQTASWIAGKNGSALSNQPTEARAAASHEAARLGSRVEVAEATTPTSITYAQPDGTFRTEFTAGPVRVERGDGWAPIDTGLVEQDGVLRPKAQAAGVSVQVSTGGTGAFASMTAAGGRSYSLSWPTPLPKPIVEKNVATFADAAGKGADLVVTALATGFRHDVVLRERPAEPLEVRIGVETEGLALSEGKGGRLLLSDGKKTVASAPRPVMWDSTPGSREAVATDVVTGNGRTELVLKPDHAFLTDPDTKYPVRVDPTVTLPLNNDVDVWASNTSGSPADPTVPNMMAGRFFGELTRTHLRFTTSSLAGATVTSAKLALTTIDSHVCGTVAGAGIQVRRLTGTWNETNLTWGNKPAATTEDAVTTLTGPGESCAGGIAPMEWTITGIAQDWAAGAANQGLVLMLPNESNTAGNYRVFASSEDYFGYGPPPTLTVTTAGAASAPAINALSVTPAQVVNGATTVTSLTPQLAGTVTDTAGGNLTGQFEIEHDPAATGQGTGQIWTGASAAIASGGQATATVPAAKLTDGWQIRWRARATSTTTSSAWSDWQRAVVDVPNPTVAQFQVTPSQQVGGTTVTTSLTPALHTLVTDPAAQPVRADFEVERNGQTWTGAANGVASGTQATVTVPGGTLTDGWQGRWRVRAVNTATTVASPWSPWQALTVDLPDPVSEPAVGALQVSPSTQVDGATVTPTRTPALLVQVADPAGKPLRAEAEIEHDGVQIWTGAADNVPAGTQASIAVPANTLTDGRQVRWRARAVSATATSEWSGWHTFTVTVPKPTATGLTITPSKVVDGIATATTLTPKLAATLVHPTGQPLSAEAEIEHDGTQVWTGTSASVGSGGQAVLTVPAGELTDGWQIRWRLRAVAGDLASPWSDWQQVTVDVTQPGEEPLAQTAEAVIRTDESFTAAAWLRWDDKEGDYSVVEQRGVHQAPFRLGNTPGDGLVFTLTGSDTAAATTQGVLSGVEPPVGEWFHLAGVYDAAAGTTALYLNGTLLQTTPVTSPAWHADTAMTLGSRIKGDLDDLQIFQRPLDAAGITALFASPDARSARLESLAAPQATAATPGFNHNHLSLEQCEDTPPMYGHPEYARIQERVYTSCWSSWVTIGTYEIEEDEDGKKKGKPASNKVTPKTGTPKSGILGLLGLSWELAQQWHAKTYLRFRTTWVATSYLGDAEGDGVVGGEGSGLNPQNMKVFVRMQDFAIIENGVRRTDHDEMLKNFQVRLDVQLESENGSPCRMTSGQAQQKRVEQWETTNNVSYLIDANPQRQGRNTVCTIKPMITRLGPQDFEVRLWSQEIMGKRGERFGVIRHGDGRADNTLYAPHFQCDWDVLGRSENVKDGVPDHIGGCINSRAHRVFIMSKSGNPGFREVIDHIEDALDVDTNKFTYPPNRPGHDWSKPSFPPYRVQTAADLPKAIPGNWGVPSSPPLTKRPSNEDHINRGFFSNIELNVDFGADGKATWKKDRGTNFCKYYFRDKYPHAKEPTWYPPSPGVQCDEFPVAASYEGAAGRDQKGHGNYSVRAVSTTHNGLHGSMMGNFYADYRINTGDSFWVLVRP